MSPEARMDEDGIERPGAQQWVPEGAGIDALKEAAKGCPSHALVHPRP